LTLDAAGEVDKLFHFVLEYLVVLDVLGGILKL